jgi:hypothetical protein
MVSYGKNEYFPDHGHLFQPSDLKPVPTYYAGKNWPEGDDIVGHDPGFGKPLAEVLDRIELMGYTARSIKHLYALRSKHVSDSRSVAFSRLRNMIAKVDVGKFTGKYRADYPRGRLIDLRTLKKLAYHSDNYNFYHPGLEPDHWEVDLILESFDPYASLWLLGQNNANRALDVTWNFTPLVEAGWADRNQFIAGPLPEEKFLVVTEGSSDAKIIQKALELYRPHIADFFRFVDMEEGYPFSGSGNLHKFVQGLVSIGIQNKVVVLYDNDAEGISKMRETQGLTLPPNVRVTQLPVLPYFRSFQTLGPSGKGRENINGKAASIECYLDLRGRGLPKPAVRWTSFSRERGIYQGELQHKTQYMKNFLEMRRPEKVYDSRRIDAVLDTLVKECVAIAEAKKLAVSHIKPSF